MITIIDYGLGNIQAFVTCYKKLNIKTSIASSCNDILNAQKLILPGVGSFDAAISKLDQSGLKNSIQEKVINDGCPILGVCVGMQIMAHSSEEGSCKGLGWIDASVKSFSTNFTKNSISLPSPHMGWNTIDEENNFLFHGIHEKQFYFLHSYFFSNECAFEHTAYTNYGFKFVSSFVSRNIMGTQFHPEKSHKAGLQLLKNFADGPLS